MLGEGGLASRHRLRQQKLNINSGAPVWPPSSVSAVGHGGDREPRSTGTGRGFSLSSGVITDLSVSLLMAEVVKAILCEKGLFKQRPRCNRSLCVAHRGIYFALSYSIRWLLVPCSISCALPFSRSYPLQDAIAHPRWKCRHNGLDWCVWAKSARVSLFSRLCLMEMNWGVGKNITLHLLLLVTNSSWFFKTCHLAPHPNPPSTNHLRDVVI